MKKNIAFLSACLLLCSLCGCSFDAAETNRTTTISAETISSFTDETTDSTRISTEMSAWQTMESDSTSLYESTAESISNEARSTTHQTVPATEGENSGTLPDRTSTTANTSATTAVPTTETTASTAKSESKETSSANKSLLRKLRDTIESGSHKKDPAFFDDVVFIGDSVTLGLKNYTNSRRNKGYSCLGSAQFLCCGSMGYTNTLGKVGSGSMHPTYKGTKVSVEDGVNKCGAGKAFIMLGMNDFNAYGEKTWKSSVTTLLDRIEAENPNVEIYLESVTPIVNGKEHGKFTNEHIRQFNAYLESVCSDRGYTYVDIYACLADASGYLKKSYCGDASAMGIHMSNEGSAAWVQYLQKTFCGTEE